MTDHEAIAYLFKDLFEYKRREARFLFIALVAVIIMNVAEVGLFVWYESHMQTTTTTTTTEQEVNGDDGNIVNGDQYNDESKNQSGGDFD